jgi:hypothetical protein
VQCNLRIITPVLLNSSWTFADAINYIERDLLTIGESIEGHEMVVEFPA